MTQQFSDRTEAGRLLAKQLKPNYGNCPDLLVLGLPRGGVPVAYEIAKVLHAPLDICIVRKLGVPGHKELAMGAICKSHYREFTLKTKRSSAINLIGVVEVGYDNLPLLFFVYGLKSLEIIAYSTNTITTNFIHEISNAI